MLSYVKIQVGAIEPQFYSALLEGLGMTDDELPQFGDPQEMKGCDNILLSNMRRFQLSFSSSLPPPIPSPDREAS